MLDMGFGEAITGILSAIPKPRQTLLFSATIPPPIRDISRRLQRDALDVTVDDDPAVALIEQRFFEVDPSRKLAALSGLLLQHRPESAVVFCNTRQEVRNVASALTAQKFTALALHGELDQRERDELLVCFANRSATVLVASDVAARGLDIADLPMVINYDLANDPDTHLHRIGRTGRAGKRGLALSLCAPAEVPRARQIEQRTGERLRWLPWVPGGRTEKAPQAAFRTVIVDAGRQDKLRPGDLLGALTGDTGLPATAIGKIDIFPTRSYVAIARDWHAQAVARLRSGKIKGRNFRIRELDLSA
jgi:ATP-independent RNA helicase DbpA